MNYRIHTIFIIIFILLMGYVSFSPNVYSQENNVWSKLGPYGGQIYDITIDPVNTDKMFAASYEGDGLFLTLDGGTTWTPVDTDDKDVPEEDWYGTEDEVKNSVVWSVKIAPSDSNAVYVSHLYWVEKSTDGGQSWNHILNGTMQSECTNCPQYDQFRYCYSIAIHPTNPQIVYVGTGGAYSGYYPYGAIYRTVDGGNSWAKLNQGNNFDYSVVDIAIDPNNPDVVWAVTDKGSLGGGNYPDSDGTLYRGEFDGQGKDTWTEIFSTEKTETSPGGGFYDVEVKPDDSNTIVTANDYGIYRHYYEDDQWKATKILDVSQPPPPPDAVFARNVRTIEFDPQEPHTLYAAWKNSHSIYDDVDQRSKVAMGAAPYSDENWEIFTVTEQFLDLAVHPSNAEILFGGELFKGVFKSQNFGQAWTSVNEGINALTVNDAAIDPNDPTHFVAATNAGTYEKKGGTSWQLISDFKYTLADAIAFDPSDADGSTFYVGTQEHLAKTINNGTQWTYSNQLENQWVSDIAVLSASSTIYLTTAPVGEGTAGVYKSADDGTSFIEVLSSDTFDFNSIAVDPSNPSHIFAGGGNFWTPIKKGNLYESYDSGATWVLTGLTNVTVNALLIDPDDPNLIYAGCGSSSGTLVPVWKSVDGGVTWQDASDGFVVKSFSGLGVWGTSSTNILFCSQYGDILQYDGAFFTYQRNPVDLRIYNSWGDSETNVFAIGQSGNLIHFDGTRWETIASNTAEDLRGIWGSSGDNIYAVGNAGTLLHYDGVAWSALESGTSKSLRAVWGTSASDVFVTGYSGTILHYDGDAWSTMNTGTTEMILGIWGASSQDVFAVGDKGTILHYNGTTWSPMNSGVSVMLQSVWGASGNDVFASGGNGTILHYDGTAWTKMTSGTEEYIWSVWGMATDNVYATGDNNNILHYDGSIWSNIAGDDDDVIDSVTDLEFSKQNTDAIYASAFKSGVYVSTNQAKSWLNLGTPEYSVRALTISSLYASTSSGMLQCTGTGVIAGNISDVETGEGIDNAVIVSDLGASSLSIDGNYQMISPAGITSLTFIADGHANQTVENIEVYGGDVSWIDNTQMDIGVPNTDLEADLDDSSGSKDGSYCFINIITDDLALHSQIGLGLTSIVFGILGLRLIGMKKKRKHRSSKLIDTPFICLFVISVIAVLTLYASELHAAGTLFGQVGIASAPNSVGSGARALGMGGAFIAMADDATAASWNPSGLIQLEKPELSVVFDYNNRSDDYSSDDHPEIENTGKVDGYGLNYFSGAYPFRFYRNMVVAVNYQRLYDFNRDLDYNFDYTSAGLDLNQDKSYEQDGSVGAAGLAAAIEISPKISVGVTVNVWTEQLFWDNGWKEKFNEQSTGTLSGVPVTYDTKITDKFSEFRGVNANIGVLWGINNNLTLGAVFKTPFKASLYHEFEYSQTQTFGPPVDTTVTSEYSFSENADLHMPMSYGLGLAWRFSDAFTVGFDIYRTDWSDYIFEDKEGNKFSPIDGRKKSDSDVQDTTQIRLGGEYLFIREEKGMVIPVRAGFFYDPEPSEGSPEDFYGIALGSGVAYKRFIFDMAYQYRWGTGVDTGNVINTSEADVSEHTVLASIIVHF